MVRLAATALVLSACAQDPIVQYQSVPIPLPTIPTWPTIPASDLACLPDDVYTAVDERDNAKSLAIKRLGAALCSTHSDPGACFEVFQ